MRFTLTYFTLLISLALVGQEKGGGQPDYQNSAEKMLASDSKLSIGGYAQIDYNQPFGGDTRYNGTLDVHRLVILFGYSFNEKTSFVTEIEFEHVSEVYVEQAFLQHSLTNNISFRGGLMLIPMGIINEYHEPPSFNGVERPVIDNYLAPTTWRELGFGFNGVFPSQSLKYQLYIVNGFKSYDDGATLNGSNGLRKGRQKGAESFMSSPNFTFRTEYFGIRGLNLGLSGYFGKTSSTLFNGVGRSDKMIIETADSSVVGVSMVGLDARYSRGGLKLRGQYYFTSLTNSGAYNIFTADNGTSNDLGSKMTGFYAELAYNLFRHIESSDYELIPFFRYSVYNTHHEVDDAITLNENYHKTILTTGLGFKLSPGSMLKTDMQFIKSGAGETYSKTFNAGIAVMF